MTTYQIYRNKQKYRWQLFARQISFLSFLLFYQQDIDPNLNFEDQILEAARSIAGATAMLVKAASAAQTELVTQGKVSTYAHTHTISSSIIMSPCNLY